MPNIKSAKKRVKISAVRRAANMSKRSELRTTIKKSLSSIAAGNLEVAKNDVRLAIIKLDKAVSKGLIHKNQAARRKSRLTKKLNALMQA
ncbi:MAG TPA: 30S ribosomal protein S20 [Bacillota bacterium]|nr:30S ribosomal protein S20 [Bacillota bacterium]